VVGHSFLSNDTNYHVTFVSVTETQTKGTTALWYLMHQSPQMRGLVTHCNFTDYDWCLTKATSTPRHANIDKGPEGTRCASLVNRMHAVAPYQKLIFLFRHPVDRLYSHYQHQVRSAEMHYNGTFQKWIHRELNKIDCFNPTTLVLTLTGQT